MECPVFPGAKLVSVTALPFTTILIGFPTLWVASWASSACSSLLNVTSHNVVVFGPLYIKTTTLPTSTGFKEKTSGVVSSARTEKTRAARASPLPETAQPLNGRWTGSAATPASAAIPRCGYNDFVTDHEGQTTSTAGASITTRSSRITNSKLNLERDMRRRRIWKLNLFCP